jgi:dipeptidyl aminopeptidase/acylaminoacyl peptidase
VRSVQRQPDSSRLIFSRDTGGSEFTQLYLFDPDSGEQPRLLTDGKSRNSSVRWNDSGTLIAYRSTRRNGSSNDIWLQSVEEPGPARMVLESPDGTYWGPADFSMDDSQLLVGNFVGNSDSRIHLLDLASGNMRMLAGDPDKPGRNLPLAFDRKGEGFWFLTDRGGEFLQLAWQSLEENASPELISGDINWNVEQFVLDRSRMRGAFTVNEDGYSRLYLIDLWKKNLAPAQGIPRGLVGSMVFSPDGRKLGLTLNNARTPSDSFVLSFDARFPGPGKLERWTYSELGGLKSGNFVEPELIHYPTFDSDSGGPESIPAWLYLPPGPGPHPVIISIHGGPESQSRPGFRYTTQMWLEKLGAAVIFPNVRGSSGYGRTFMSLDNDYLREDSVKDIGALLDWVAARKELDSQRVAVIGGSYGGYMVLASAVHYSERLKAAIDVVGISNFVTFLENTQDYRRDLRRVEYGDERDPQMRAYLEKISPLNNVEKIRVPLLVVQGENDPRVPVTEASQMVAALREANQTVWYMNALNEGHGYRRKENRDIYNQATVLFLQKYLLGGGE